MGDVPRFVEYRQVRTAFLGKRVGRPLFPLRVEWRRHEDDSGALLSGLTGQGFHRRPGGGATSRGGHAGRDASRETRRTTCHRRWSRRLYGEPILVPAAEDGVDGRAGVAGRQRTLRVGTANRQ
jgi:hypothetical protein